MRYCQSISLEGGEGRNKVQVRVLVHSFVRCGPNCFIVFTCCRFKFYINQSSRSRTVKCLKQKIIELLRSTMKKSGFSLSLFMRLFETDFKNAVQSLFTEKLFCCFPVCFCTWWREGVKSGANSIVDDADYVRGL